MFWAAERYQKYSIKSGKRTKRTISEVRVCASVCMENNASGISSKVCLNELLKAHGGAHFLRTSKRRRQSGHRASSLSTPASLLLKP